MLSVGNRVADDRLKEELEDTTGLVVDKTGDTLNTTSSCETADSGLGDTLDVVSQDLSEQSRKYDERSRSSSARCSQWIEGGDQDVHVGLG